MTGAYVGVPSQMMRACRVTSYHQADGMPGRFSPQPPNQHSTSEVRHTKHDQSTLLNLMIAFI